MHAIGLSSIVVTILLALFSMGCNGNANAQSSQPIRILVYNIHAGKDVARKDNIARVAELITLYRADVVFLQEVDRNTTRSGKVDQLAELARLTGLNAAFGRAIDFEGGEYGVGLLCRFPIKQHRIEPLTVKPRGDATDKTYEARIALVAEISAPFGPLNVVNTHLDADRLDDLREQQAFTLIRLSNEGRTREGRFILAGDFNSTPESTVYRAMLKAGLRDGWLEAGDSSPGHTIPQDKPTRRIDYLFRGHNIRCTKATVLDSQASDHRAVLFVLEP